MRNIPGKFIIRANGSVAIQPGDLGGKPGYRGRDPQEPWRRLYEQADQIVQRWAGYEIDDDDLLDALYAPGGLKALPPWDEYDVQDVLDHPHLIQGAGEILDALLDGRLQLVGAADGLREALYQVLKARRVTEGSSRLKALQRLEGCKACQRIDFVTRPDGTRVCGCGREWAFDVEIRTRVVNAPLKGKRVQVKERTLVSKGRTLITVEV